ncbi:lysophospholipid acyltransferase family protein [Candidatus Kinetoplastidibacterium crithidiae]|nr:lysophospholipid acyltransferase family protein [Candidatus Kinetoplastibacterium crithidii]AFZ82493.1 1-acyl-sn-glycerol-3-phosphate acyltransferase [Candidatus Kinetoplastibacterium crithidii (ex Angomonas deanei ATCC 30255)]
MTFALPLNIRYKIITFWPKIALFGLKFICNLQCHIKGIDRIPTQPLIIVSNHQSIWETLFFIAYFPKKICFIYKKELNYIPFFGWGLILLDMIAINRSDGFNSFKKVSEIGTEKLKHNYSILIFPEGTRAPSGKIQKFKIGASLLAKNTRCNILPIVHNAGNFWKKNSFMIQPGIIQLSIGDVITIDSLTPGEINIIIYEWIKKEFDKINCQDHINQN